MPSPKNVLAAHCRVGDTIRAPWREFGDDKDLTGVVFKRTSRGAISVRWNGDGDVTPEGDESTFGGMTTVERMED